MRFEEMNRIKQDRFLKRLYNNLNRDFFNSELRGTHVSIGSAHLYFDELKRGEFGQYFPLAEAGLIDSIELTFDFVDELKKLPTQKAQAYNIMLVLLHEMTHQYCEQHHIKHERHEIEFQNECIKHGFISKYIDNEQQEEFLLDNASLYASLFIRIR